MRPLINVVNNYIFLIRQLCHEYMNFLFYSRHDMNASEQFLIVNKVYILLCDAVF